MLVKFRPHHFLCTFCFEGKGYSPTFIKNYATLLSYLTLEKNAEVKIEVVGKTDSICDPCPHKREDKCTAEDKIKLLDDNHAHALSIFPGDKITWREAQAIIKQKITLPIFHNICKECAWKKAGICQAKIEKTCGD